MGDSKKIRDAGSGMATYTLGLESTHTNREQVMVLRRALRIFESHTNAHGELWKDSSPNHLSHHIKHKADRIYQAEIEKLRGNDQGKWDIDSAMDLINYAVFYIRQVEAGKSDE